MERVTLDIERCHLLVADLDPLGVSACIQFAADRQTGFGRGGSDQFDDGFAADQWLASPGLGDMAEHSVFDLVPLRGSWGVMADLTTVRLTANELRWMPGVRRVSGENPVSTI